VVIETIDILRVCGSSLVFNSYQENARPNLGMSSYLQPEIPHYSKESKHCSIAE